MAELQGHALGLKSRFPLTDFVIIIQPIFTEGLCQEQVAALSEIHFPKMGRMMFTLKGSYENQRSYRVPDKGESS